jgi:hypothetical protein
MPRGDKSAYTDKQKRQAEHIEEGYRREGTSRKRAERIAWATVNKQDGGGLKRKPAGKRSTRGGAARSGPRARSRSPQRSRARSR